MFHPTNIAILLRYFDISVIGFVILSGYCISVFERYCTSVVNTYILPSPILMTSPEEKLCGVTLAKR